MSSPLARRRPRARNKFTKPYGALIDQKVEFYAALGNHDDPNQKLFTPFHMGGKRYYSFKKGNVRFFVLDTDALDPKQLAWLDAALGASQEAWKICYFHHPLYSNGATHGSEVNLRVILEPMFQKHGVNVVFAGHDHIYERLVPQKGIQYFVSGSAGQLRKGDLRRSKTTAAGFDEDCSFMLVEILDRELSFQAVSRTGQVVDTGTVHLP